MQELYPTKDSSWTHKELLQVNRQRTQYKKGERPKVFQKKKPTNQTTTKNDVQMTDKQKEIQLHDFSEKCKLNMTRSSNTSTTIPKTKKPENFKCWWECKATGTLIFPQTRNNTNV